LQAGSGAWIGQTPGAGARAEWVNNAYYDSVNTRWEYIAADEANRIYLENGELHLQSAAAGSADGLITWNERLAMTVGGDFKIGPNAGIGITISSSGNVDAIGIVTCASLSSAGAISGTTGTFSNTGSPNSELLKLVNTQHDTNAQSSAQLKFGITNSLGERNVRIEAKEEAGNTNDVALDFYTNNTSSTNGETKRLSITAAGHVVPGTDSAYDLGLTGTRFRAAYVDTYYGDGSNLTGITQTTINSNADNRVITGSGTANTLNGESNLTYDGNTLQVATDANMEGIKIISSGNTYNDIQISANRSGSNNHIGRILGQWNGGNVTAIIFNTGADTSGKDDGEMVFATSSGGSSPTERVRIDSGGRLVVGHTEARTVNAQKHRIQLIGTTYATSGLSQQRYQNDVSGASIILSHSRNGTIGGQTALQSGDELGKIRFVGSDGVDLENVGAQIVVKADGNYSSDSVPGKIEFGTTSNGENSPTTRMTIDQNGYVKINSGDGSAYHTIRLNTTTNNAIKDVVQILSTVTGGTAADGFGSRLLLAGENLNGNSYPYGAIAGKLSTTGSNYGHLSFYTNNNGTLGEKMRLTDSSSGNLEVLGNSASIKTVESGGATGMIQSGGSQAYFGTPSGNNKAVTFIVNGSHIAHFTTNGDMMLDNQIQTSSGVEPIGQLSFSGSSGALQNQTDMYRINFWENARSITSTRTDNSNASIRYNGSTADGGDGSIRFANESGTRLLYMNRLGNGGTSGAWSVGSDQRKKENITTVSDALSKVNQLRGVDFNWRAKWGGQADSGVIAQEVESVLPNLVITQEGARDTDEDGNSVIMKHVNYNGLTGVLIEAIKELSAENTALKNLIKNSSSFATLKSSL